MFWWSPVKFDVCTNEAERNAEDIEFPEGLELDVVRLSARLIPTQRGNLKSLQLQRLVR